MEPDSTERREMSPVEKADKAWSFAFQITSGSAAPMALKAVIELGVLEIIKKAGPSACMSPAEIAAQLPTSNPEAAAMLGRMLRLLASYSVLSHSLKMLPDGSPQQLYGLAPVCEFLTKNGDDGASLAPFFLMLQDKVIMESWYRLKDAVLEGTEPAFSKAHGTHVYEYCGKDPRFNSILNEAMSNHSTITVKKILDNYDGFKDLSSLVDVGGGIGVTLSMIVSKYPTIKGINFDLPHVVENAPSYPGVEHVGGDMYVTVPKGDAILLKWICHNWEDKECLKLLKNCYQALPADHGKVVACEHVLPDKPETSNSAKAIFNLDVIMLAQNGGKERTEEEFEAIAKEAGFAGFKVACSAYSTTVMEFLKK